MKIKRVIFREGGCDINMNTSPYKRLQEKHGEIIVQGAARTAHILARGTGYKNKTKIWP
jgi:hypothetical protein